MESKLFIVSSGNTLSQQKPFRMKIKPKSHVKLEPQETRSLHDKYSVPLLSENREIQLN